MSDRARLWVWGAVLGILTTIAVLAGLTAVYVADSVHPAQEARQAQQRALQAQQRAVRLLIECTTAPALRDPPETQPLADDCYLRQQRAQSKILGEPSGPINTVAVAASACGAAHPGDVAATLRCVREAVRR